MANEQRVRGNNAQGTVSDNPLTAGATTLNSAGLANFPAVSAAQHAVIVLDPLRTAGAPEIITVTAHTAAATSATVLRGQYGTAARSHNQNTMWVHPTTIDDLIGIYTSATRPSTPYRGELIFETDTNSYVGRDTTDTWQTVVTLGAWTAYTPTLTQSATVTKTVSYAKYIKVGRMVTVSGVLAVTGSGTASNQVLIGLPVTAVSAVGPLGIPIVGSGYIHDTSATAYYGGLATLTSTTTMALIPTASTTPVNYLGVTGFTAALAAGDTVAYSATYETAS